jgi:hypothetical protein
MAVTGAGLNSFLEMAGLFIYSSPFGASRFEGVSACFARFMGVSAAGTGAVLRLSCLLFEVEASEGGASFPAMMSRSLL